MEKQKEGKMVRVFQNDCVVIVPSYEHFGYLFRALASINAIPIVIDDASPGWSPFIEDKIKQINPKTIIKRYETNGGLTRSWNEGLRIAKEKGFRYAICTNNDVIFAASAIHNLCNAPYSLTAPCTNAPGCYDAQLLECESDSSDAIAKAATQAQQKPADKVNGFCMCGTVSDWWANAFDANHVFNPANTMTKNEDELQTRWQGSIGIADAFVFHYRSVSRGLKHGALDRGAYRPKEKIAVYTAIFDGYDEIKGHPNTDADYILFTNSNVKTNWQVRKVPYRGVRYARKIKCLPHEFLPNYDWWVWLDGSLWLEVDPKDIIHLHAADIAAFEHPNRTCIYEESKAVLDNKRDTLEYIRPQMQRYQAEGYKTGMGLAETTMVVRRNTPNIRKFNSLWWSEICKGSHRDQLSFDYCCWKLGIHYAKLPGCGMQNPYATHYRHRRVRPLIIWGGSDS